MSLSASLEAAEVLGVTDGMGMNSCSLSILPVSRQLSFWASHFRVEKSNISHDLRANSSYFHLTDLEGRCASEKHGSGMMQ
jgi:hypothetical protein